MSAPSQPPIFSPFHYIQLMLLWFINDIGSSETVYEGRLISLWLYKENNKLQD
jgi:hypothetical protein